MIPQQLLIDRADIAKYKQISKSVDENTLKQHIREAQENDLKPLLGERLYNTILATPSDYEDLINGHSYEFGGITYINQGLKGVLVYYTFARYTMFGDVTDTPYSMVNKLAGAESRPVDYQFKKSMYTNNRDMAYNVFLTVDAFLRRSGNTLYLQNCTRKSTGGFTFNKIL